MTPDQPRLRQLEVIPSTQDGQQVLILRDPIHLSEVVMLVPMGLVPVLQRLDGFHTLEQIHEDTKREYRIDIPIETIRRTVSQLGEAHFLEGEKFEDLRQRLERSYLSAPIRENFLAGRSYEADPVALRATIDGFFTQNGGPGLPSFNGANGHPPLRGVVAPHIDFNRGGSTFACSYRAVSERADADVFVVLGTVHAPTRSIYSTTRKNFETPLGIQEVDEDFVDSLAERAPEDLYCDEFAQRGEHSIEFQAVFLQYLYAQTRPVKFVPVLVGSFGEFVAEGRSPKGDERVEGFVAALRDTTNEMRNTGRKVCFLASVDLAHVGPQFGDDKLVDAQQLEALEAQDRESLEAVCRGDAEDFYWSVAKDGDARKVCGLAPIYTMLRTMGSCKGEILRYSQWPDPNGTVTFCSLIIE